MANPITISEGTGVTIGGAGSFNGGVPQTFTFSIGQDVATTSTVQFQNVSASNALHIGATSFEISQREDNKAQVNTDWVVLGDIIAENYIISSSVTHMTTSFSQGNTQFGDSLDDVHSISGSSNVSGSFGLNGTSVSEISNDITLGDSNASSLVTENATKEYLNTTLGSAAKLAYLRKSFTHTGSFTSANTSSFTAVTASAPSGVTGTTENDFIFFVNGMMIENDALEIVQKTSTNLELRLDTSELGYSLESDDEVIGFGKFNS